MFVTRRRYEQELAAAKAETDRQRERAEKAESEKATAVYNRRQIAAQLADADAANRRLHGRNLALGERISKLTEADPEHAAALAQRVHRLQKVGARILAAWSVEKRRADRLQRELDDAVGLGPRLIQDSSRWQPGYKTPKEAKA